MNLINEGMLSTGNTKPERIIFGIAKKYAVINACCCVLETTDEKIPKPSVVIRKINVETKSKNKLPRNGTSRFEIFAIGTPGETNSPNSTNFVVTKPDIGDKIFDFLICNSTLFI
jgi:hypothetical protein